jgi:hypothetical protein
VNFVNIGEVKFATMCTETETQPYSPSVKEIKMNKNLFFNLIVIMVLAVMAALTISQAAAANRIESAASNQKTFISGQANQLSSVGCAALGVSGSPIQMVYVERSGAWIPFEDGVPTGVEGGLLQLLNDRRSCSK